MPNALQEIKKLKSQHTIAVALALLFVCMGFWILVSIGQSSHQSQIDPILIEMAKPLNPTLDLSLLAKIEKKRFMSTVELSDFPIYIIGQDPTTRSETIQTITAQTDKVIQTVR